MICLKFLLLFVTCAVYQWNSVKSNPLGMLAPAKTEESEEAAYRKLLQIESNLLNKMRSATLELTKKYIGQEDALLNLNITSKCVNSALILKQGLLDLRVWAYEMLDSTAIPGGGVLTGTYSSMGYYSECLNIGRPEEALFGFDHSSPIKGKYCIVNSRGPLPPRPSLITFGKKTIQKKNYTFKTDLMNQLQYFLFRFYDSAYTTGVCIPADCSEHDLSTFLEFIFKDSGFQASIQSCEVKEPLSIDNLQLFTIVTAIVVTAVCFLMSVIDEVQRYSEPKDGNLKKNVTGYGTDIVRAFSIRRNFVQLMKTKAMDDKTLECMNGLRYFSTLWVLLGHSYNMHGRTTFRSAMNARHIIGSILFQVIANGFLSVVSFLFIGSTLISYSVVKIYDTRRTFNPIILIIRRAFRLLPSVILAFGVMFLMPLIGSGPTYKKMTTDYYQICRENWWSTALFIGNFMEFKSMCLNHAWYLCVDMQLFLIAILYFFVLFRNKFAAKVYLAISLLVCILSCGIVIYIKGYPPTMIFTVMDINFVFDYMYNFFTMPNVYLGPYAIGLFLGTYLARVKAVPEISTRLAIIGWVVASCLGMVAVFAVYPWNNGEPYSRLEAVSFGALYRTTWTLALAWLVFACYIGKGGFVNSILSWTGYQPLIKISYLVYLMHPFVGYHYDLGLEGSLDASNSILVYFFCGMTVLSHLICVPLRVLWEAPIMNLEKLLWKCLLTRRKRERCISTNINGVTKVTEEAKSNNEMMNITMSIKKEDNC